MGSCIEWCGEAGGSGSGWGSAQSGVKKWVVQGEGGVLHTVVWRSGWSRVGVRGCIEWCGEVGGSGWV